MNSSRFADDLTTLLTRLARDGSQVRPRLEELKGKLVDFYLKNQINIYHSSLELLCAGALLDRGFGVDVEHRLASDLVCDVYGTKGDGTVIVEIETGYVPPDHALDPATYTRARLASKIARYSPHASAFVLAAPLFTLLPIPSALFKHPRDRTDTDILQLKALCDRYYAKPPVRIEEIVTGRLHAIYRLEVDAARVVELDPEHYARILSSAQLTV